MELETAADDEVVVWLGGRCWPKLVSSCGDDGVAVSEVVVYVGVADFCEEERRGCCSVEAFGDEVLRLMARSKSSEFGRGGDGATR